MARFSFGEVMPLGLVEDALQGTGVPEELIQRLVRAGAGAARSARHHYVPKAYLRAWAENERVGVWDTMGGRTYVTNLDNVCVVGDWMTIEHEGDRVRDLEGIMALSDGALARRLHELRARSLPPDLLARWETAFLIADLWSRGPQLRRLHDESTTLMMRVLAQDDLRRAGDNPAHWWLENHQNNQLKFATDIMAKAAADWVRRGWTIYEAGNDVLQTSDNPVLLDGAGASYRPGAATADRILVALSPRHLLVFAAPAEGGSLAYQSLTRPIRETYERLLHRSRERWIIGTGKWVRTRRPARIERRWHSIVRCFGQDSEGACVLNTSTRWREGPLIEECRCGRLTSSLTAFDQSQ